MIPKFERAPIAARTHHDTAKQADSSAAVRVGYDIAVAHTQKRNRYQPEAIQNVVVVVGVVVPEKDRHKEGKKSPSVAMDLSLLLKQLRFTRALLSS